MNKTITLVKQVHQSPQSELPEKNTRHTALTVHTARFRPSRLSGPRLASCLRNVAERRVQPKAKLIERPFRSTKLQKQRKSAQVGSHFVLSLLMRSYPSEDRAASVTYGDGVKVIVHERRTYPSPTAVEFTAAANHETIAQLDGTVLTSTSDVLKLSARARGCSTTGSQDDRPYRSDNCQAECRDSAVWKLCECTPLSAATRAAQPCDLTHIPCLARAVLRTNLVVERDPRCTCLPDCEGTTYRVALATAPLDAARYSPRPF